jgi:ubiquinone/menaquinone biosynthesis C-methylase UbiE
LFVAGLDESRQMGRLALRRLRRGGCRSPRLVRGVAQRLPFPDAYFDTLVATFPAEYIFAAETLSEARRVLKSGARLVVLPVAWPRNPLLGLLFRVTGQSPSEAVEAAKARLLQPFAVAGFEVEIADRKVESGMLLIVTATNPEVTHVEKTA